MSKKIKKGFRKLIESLILSRYSSSVKGAFIGAITGSILFLAIYFLMISNMIGSPLVIPGLSVSIILLILFYLLIRHLILLLRPISLPVLSISAACFLTLVIVLSSKPLPVIILVFILIIPLPILLGFSIGLIYHQTRTPRSSKVIPVFFFLIVLSLNILFILWLTGSGSDSHLVSYQSIETSIYPGILPGNPSLQGSYPVIKISYGSGRERQRPEYGELVNLTTPTVDISPFLPDKSTLQRKFRSRYWGFDIDEIPLNALVWYPDGEGNFPLFVIVHGNHNMYDRSEKGYEYLGMLLASRGHIVVSIDQNFLNFSWLGEGFNHQEISVRGWLILEHLKLWSEWNEQSGHIFHNKIDLENIALMGHSRGGEAIVISALFNQLPCFPDNASIKFDYGFSIKSLIAVAPSEGFYKPAGQSIVLDNISYLLLQGGADGDLMIFSGIRQYNRINITENDTFKALLYIYQANHGYFNSEWGRTDLSFPLGIFLNKKPIMSRKDQEKITEVYISSFLEATLKDNRTYRTVFQNSDLIANWLPETIYLNLYTDSSYKVISNFKEDFDLTTTTIPQGRISTNDLTYWREDYLPLRFRSIHQEAKGVFIGWQINSPDDPYYQINLPANSSYEWGLNKSSNLLISLTSTKISQPTPDFLIELTTTDNVSSFFPLSTFRHPLPPLQLKSTKLGFIEELILNRAELIANTYFIHLSAYTEDNIEFKPDRIEQIRLIFDKDLQGDLVISDIGFLP